MAQRDVLLTGATGFVGNLVLAMLLRRTDIDRVSCLIRKRTGSVDKRLRRVLAGPAFKGLPEEVLDRAVAVEGDLTAQALGLDDGARQELVGRVTDVVSVAASVRFDMPGPEAVAVNVDGPLRLLDLAEELGASRMVHVSTAYVHPPGLGPHDPVRIALPEPAEVLVEQVRVAAEPVMERLGYPNSYTLTKCLAEGLLLDRARSVAVQLVRPSIVSAAWQWPEPGWVASTAALPGVMAAIGSGIYKLGIGDPDVHVDVVPVDVVARRVIEAMDPGAAPIVHAVAGRMNSATTVDIVGLSHQAMAVRDTTGLPQGVVVQRPGLAAKALHTALNVAPLAASARLAGMQGNNRARRLAVNGQQIVARMQQEFLPFTTHEWDFSGGDLPVEFDRYAYHRTSAAGVRRWTLRQDGREESILGGRQPESDLGWMLRRGPAGVLQRGVGVALRQAARRFVDRATVDAVSLREALAQVPPGHRVVLCPNHRSYVDALLVSYALQSLSGLGLDLPDLSAEPRLKEIPVVGRLLGRLESGRVLQLFVEGGRSRSGAFLPPQPGLLRRLQASRERYALVPLSIAYDEVPELTQLLGELHGERDAAVHRGDPGRWLARAGRGEVALGRMHLSASAPIRLGPDDDASQVCHALVGRLQSGVATTGRHLAAFAERAGLSAADLQRTLQARGARVLHSKLDLPRSDRVERWMRSHWLHHLAPELASLAEGNPFLQDHLRRTLWSPVPCHPADPVALTAARAHLAEVERDWRRTLDIVREQPAITRAEVLQRASGAWPVEVEAALDQLVQRGVLLEARRGLEAGPAFSAVQAS